jgi:hypothetical protein
MISSLRNHRIYVDTQIITYVLLIYSVYFSCTNRHCPYLWKIYIHITYDIHFIYIIIYIIYYLFWYAKIRKGQMRSCVIVNDNVFPGGIHGYRSISKFPNTVSCANIKTNKKNNNDSASYLFKLISTSFIREHTLSMGFSYLRICLKGYAMSGFTITFSLEQLRTIL